MTFLVLATISIQQKDLIFGICAIVMLGIFLTIFFTRTKNDKYPSEYYWKIVLSSFLSIIPSFLSYSLIKDSYWFGLDKTITLLNWESSIADEHSPKRKRFCWY